MFYNLCKPKDQTDSEKTVSSTPSPINQMNEMDFQKIPTQNYINANFSKVFNNTCDDIDFKESPISPQVSGSTSELNTSNSHLLQNLSQIELTSLQTPHADTNRSYTKASTATAAWRPSQSTPAGDLSKFKFNSEFLSTPKTHNKLKRSVDERVTATSR